MAGTKALQLEHRYCRQRRGRNQRKELRGFRTRASTSEEPPAGAPPSWSPRAQERMKLLVAKAETESQEARARNESRFSQADTLQRRAKDMERALGLRHGEGMQQGGEEAEEGIRLRARMQEAIERESYEEAAELRNRLEELRLRRQSAPGPSLRQGLIVKHSSEGWKGVVCGHDSRCEEGQAWRSRALAPGSQPSEEVHYLVLLDERDGDFVSGGPPAAYAPESLLEVVQHPPEEGVYNFLLQRVVLGRDGQGHYVPSKIIREFHRQPQIDIWPDSSEPRSSS